MTLKNIIDQFAVKYPSHPTDGLLWYYPFNWNANDESGNWYNGTVNGAILTTDRFWNANRAYSFNWSSDYISIWDVINPWLWNLSFSAWFNTTTAGAFQSILTKSRAAGANWRYWVMFTWWTLYSFIDFDIWATIWNVTTPEAPYIDWNWHNVCVTIQRNWNLTMYVDWINKWAIDISAHVATNCTSTDILWIWAYNNSTWTALTQGFFNWKIWITSLYNRVLKEEEIQKIYIWWLISYTGSSVENFGASSDIAFDYTKSLDALTKTAETTDFWWHIDREWVLQFHPKTGAVWQLHHKLDDGNDIIDINVEENSENVVNKYILFYTGGNVTAEDLTSQATYWIRERKDTKTEITNATTANATASAYIEANKDQKRRIRISINTNYDIESIRPGDLITVRNISYNISGLQINKIEYNPDNITVELDDVLSFGKEVFTS